MTQIDRIKVRRAFSEKSGNYDDLAVVQQRVVRRFLDGILASGSEPSAVLDVGAGTGRLLESLLVRFPSLFAVGLDMAHGMARSAARRLPAESDAALVCADGEHLPFRDCSFDTVVSTSTYQWLNPLDSAFAEALRVLKPGGRFCFAMFGESTLFELKASYRQALLLHGSSAADRSHRFSSRAETLEALGRAGFTECRVTSETEVERHRDVPALLRSLKGIGAGNAAPVQGKGLGGRTVTAAMIDQYEKNYGGDSGIPATYEVLYGQGIRRG